MFGSALTVAPPRHACDCLQRSLRYFISSALYTYIDRLQTSLHSQVVRLPTDYVSKFFRSLLTILECRHSIA